MRSNSLKFVLGLGLFSLLAMGVPACSDDDDGGGSSGSAGTGGAGGSGGSAGSSGSGGSAGSSGSAGSAGGGVVCGGQTCDSWMLGGLVNLPACCTDTDACGAESTATIESLAGVPQGCYPLGEPGNVECDCPPSPEFDNPLEPGEKVSFPGCCRTGGTCGYLVNLTSAEGPDLGCAEPWAHPTPAACTAGTPNPCPEPDGGADGGPGDASAD